MSRSLRVGRRGAGQTKPAASVPVVGEVLRSPGQPLEASTRAFMEPRFGHDFSAVRVHADAPAAEAATALEARAFTSRKSIVFGTGELLPQTGRGRRLLAHELTHVVQQSVAGPRDEAVGAADGRHERQADRAAEAIVRGERAPPIGSGLPTATPLLQRQAARPTAEIATATEESAAAGAAESAAAGCTFELAIDGVTYCFVVKSDKYKDGLYHISATASGAGAQATTYSVDVGTAVEGDRLIITSPLTIAMTVQSAGTPTVKAKPLRVPLRALEDALNAGVAASAAAQDAWDFVVLQVQDDVEHGLPRRIVYWLGDPNRPPAQPGKRIAAFRIQRSELAAKLNGKDYYLALTGSKGFDPLNRQQVTELIAGRSPEPEGTSTTGFDSSTYVGRLAQAPRDEAGKSLPSFEVAAGHPTSSGGYAFSMIVSQPPPSIAASFVEKESTIPGGLEPGSVARLENEVALVLLYLRDTPEVGIEIRASTDTVGDEASNNMLSEARAQNAKKYLTDATVWTGTPGVPPALEPSRILLVKGEGQTAAAKALKLQHPADWQQLIGKKAARDPAFRKFDIKYVVR